MKNVKIGYCEGLKYLDIKLEDLGKLNDFLGGNICENVKTIINQPLSHAMSLNIIDYFNEEKDFDFDTQKYKISKTESRVGQILCIDSEDTDYYLIEKFHKKREKFLGTPFIAPGYEYILDNREMTYNHITKNLFDDYSGAIFAGTHNFRIKIEGHLQLSSGSFSRHNGDSPVIKYGKNLKLNIQTKLGTISRSIGIETLNDILNILHMEKDGWNHSGEFLFISGVGDTETRNEVGISENILEASTSGILLGDILKER